MPQTLRYFGKLLAVIFTVYLVYVLAIFLLQREFLFVPGTTLHVPQTYQTTTSFHEVTVATANGLTLTSWYNAPDGDKPHIIFFQGNSGTISDRLPKVQTFTDAGFGVLLVGYRGYGNNPDHPSEAGLYEDARSNIYWLIEKGIPENDIILYGESLGTALAIEMALQFDIKGVLLEAPFASAARFAADHYPLVPFNLILKDQFNTANKIADVTAPIFIFHGGKDKVTNVAHSEDLFTLATKPKSFAVLPDAGHNNLYEYGAAPVVLNYMDKLDALGK